MKTRKKPSRESSRRRDDVPTVRDRTHEAVDLERRHQRRRRAAGRMFRKASSSSSMWKRATPTRASAHGRDIDRCETARRYGRARRAAARQRFGRSYKAENTYETLSDSLIEATYNLLSNPASTTRSPSHSARLVLGSGLMPAGPARAPRRASSPRFNARVLRSLPLSSDLCAFVSSSRVVT